MKYKVKVKRFIPEILKEDHSVMYGIECDIGNKKCWSDFKYGYNDQLITNSIARLVEEIIETYQDEGAQFETDQSDIDNAVDYVVQGIKADLEAGQAILVKYKELAKPTFEEAANNSKSIVKDIEIEMKNGSIDELYISADDKNKLEKAREIISITYHGHIANLEAMYINELGRMETEFSELSSILKTDVRIPLVGWLADSNAIYSGIPSDLKFEEIN